MDSFIIKTSSVHSSIRFVVVYVVLQGFDVCNFLKKSHLKKKKKVRREVEKGDNRKSVCPEGPQTCVCNGGSKVTTHKLAIGLLTALLIAAVIGLVLTCEC